MHRINRLGSSVIMHRTDGRNILQNHLRFFEAAAQHAAENRPAVPKIDDKGAVVTAIFEHKKIQPPKKLR